MTTGMSAAEQELAAAQRARFDATIAGDTATLERLMSDDILYFHSTGRIDTKRSYLDNLVTRGLPYRAFQYDTPTVRVFGDSGITTAVIHLTLRNAEGVEDTHPSRCTQVWTKTEGGWQEVLWQATRMPD